MSFSIDAPTFTPVFGEIGLHDDFGIGEQELSSPYAAIYDVSDTSVDDNQDDSDHASSRKAIVFTYPFAEGLTVLPPALPSLCICVYADDDDGDRDCKRLKVDDKVTRRNHTILSYLWSPTRPGSLCQTCVNTPSPHMMASRCCTLLLTNTCEYLHYKCPLLQHANIDAYQFMLRWQLQRQAWIMWQLSHNDQIHHRVSQRLQSLRYAARKHGYEVGALRQRLKSLENILWQSIVIAQRHADPTNPDVAYEECEYVRYMGYEMTIVQLALMMELVGLRARSHPSAAQWYQCWTDVTWWDFCMHTI